MRLNSTVFAHSCEIRLQSGILISTIIYQIQSLVYSNAEDRTYLNKIVLNWKINFMLLKITNKFLVKQKVENGI